MIPMSRGISVLLIVGLLSQLALARSNIHDWNNVRIVELGSTVIVKTKQGEKYEGTLDFAYVDSLAVMVTVPRAMRQLITLRRDEIKEVRTRLSRFASGAIGAGIGLGVGIGLGHISDSKQPKYNEDPGLGKLLGGFLGILGGLAAGSAVGFGSKAVYVAP